MREARHKVIPSCMLGRGVGRQRAPPPSPAHTRLPRQRTLASQPASVLACSGLQMFGTEAYDRRTVFLSMGKWEPRKAFDVLLSSYFAAFNGSEAANTVLEIGRAHV